MLEISGLLNSKMNSYSWHGKKKLKIESELEIESDKDKKQKYCNILSEEKTR